MHIIGLYMCVCVCVCVCVHRSFYKVVLPSLICNYVDVPQSHLTIGYLDNKQQVMTY